MRRRRGKRAIENELKREEGGTKERCRIRELEMQGGREGFFF